MTGGAIRGPSGPIPGPPPDLAACDLPLTRSGAGSTLCRIHRLAFRPIFFSPGPGAAPVGRFDSPTGRFGALYAAGAFEIAVAETVLRNPARTIIGIAEIGESALSLLALAGETVLVDLTGPGLSRLGLDARFLSGPYDPCGTWAEALHDHPSRPDGILYPSRFDPSGTCAVLFDRAAPRLSVAGDAVPLADMPREVAAVLDRYRKALDPG